VLLGAVIADGVACAKKGSDDANHPAGTIPQFSVARLMNARPSLSVAPTSMSYQDFFFDPKKRDCSPRVLTQQQ
jgi:hypothetical protein